MLIPREFKITSGLMTISPFVNADALAVDENKIYPEFLSHAAAAATAAVAVGADALRLYAAVRSFHAACGKYSCDSSDCWDWSKPACRYYR